MTRRSVLTVSVAFWRRTLLAGAAALPQAAFGQASSGSGPISPVAERPPLAHADLPAPPPNLRSRLIGLQAGLEADIEPPPSWNGPTHKPAPPSRSSALSALSGAERLPMPPLAEEKPPPVVPASPPSAYRPSATEPTASPLPPTASPLQPAPPVSGARLVFPAASAELTLEMQQELDRLVAFLQASEHVRVRIAAYAEGTVETASQARRLSLQRALAVRNYLGGKGVAGTRALIEALGASSQEGPANRVDLQMVSGS